MKKYYLIKNTTWSTWWIPETKEAYADDMADADGISSVDAAVSIDGAAKPDDMRDDEDSDDDDFYTPEEFAAAKAAAMPLSDRQARQLAEEKKLHRRNILLLLLIIIELVLCTLLISHMYRAYLVQNGQYVSLDTSFFEPNPKTVTGDDENAGEMNFDFAEIGIKMGGESDF